MKKIIIILVSIMLFSGCYVFATAKEDVSTSNQDIIVRVKQKQDNLSKSATEEAVEASQDFVTKKAVANKKTPKQIILKFILSMMWVIISSAIIFGILVGYKKIANPKTNIIQDKKNDSLDSPKTFKEAVNLFLDKTKWE